MVVLAVIVLWCIVSVMAALSVGRFCSMSNEPARKPVPILRAQPARPSPPEPDERGSSRAEAA